MEAPRMEMLVVGITGRKGSGKTSLVNCLLDMLEDQEYSCEYLPLSAPLKEACKALFPTDDPNVWYDEKRKERPLDNHFGLTPRKIMQFMGTEILRGKTDMLHPELGADFFIHNWRQQIFTRYKKGVDIVLTDDVRFDNECQAIHNYRGVVIKIDRPTNTAQIDTHISETGVSDYDYHLINSSSIEQLALKAYEIIVEKFRQLSA